jgi:hypothetical protein
MQTKAESVQVEIFKYKISNLKTYAVKKSRKPYAVNMVILALIVTMHFFTV